MTTPKVPKVDPSLLQGVVPPAKAVAKPQAARGPKRTYTPEDHKKFMQEMAQVVANLPKPEIKIEGISINGRKPDAIFAVVKTYVSGAPIINTNEKGKKTVQFDIKGYKVRELITGKEMIGTAEDIACAVAAAVKAREAQGKVCATLNFTLKAAAQNKKPYIQAGGIDPTFKTLHDPRLVEYITEPVIVENGQTVWKVKDTHIEIAKALGYNERTGRTSTGAKTKTKKATDPMAVVNSIMSSIKPELLEKYKDVF